MGRTKIMSKRIVTIGECMVELSRIGEDSYRQRFAGDVYNTAVYLKRTCEQPVTVHFMSAVGIDPLSERLVKEVQKEGLDARLLFRAPKHRVGLYLIDVDDNGERKFIYWRETSAARQTMQCFTDARADWLLEGVDLCFLSGITLAILPPPDRELMFSLLAELKQAGCQIVFDPNYRPALWPSLEEAAAVLSRAYALADLALPGLDDHRLLFSAAKADDVVLHLQELGVREIVVKDGINGVRIAVDGRCFSTPAYPVAKVVDTTAAGDSFNGGYLSARLAGANPEAASQFAARLASFVVEHPGAIVEPAAFAAFTERWQVTG